MVEADGSAALLMAAERPLLQDPPLRVRLLRWGWKPDRDPCLDAPQAQEQGALLLAAGEGWGLTELLVVGSGRPRTCVWGRCAAMRKATANGWLWPAAPAALLARAARSA